MNNLKSIHEKKQGTQRQRMCLKWKEEVVVDETC